MASTAETASVDPPVLVPAGVANTHARELAEELRALRVKRRLSRAQLAEAAGISVLSLERVEEGGHESLHPGVVHAVAAALEHRIVLRHYPQPDPRARELLAELFPTSESYAEAVRRLDDPDLATT